jgi:hypothetical protein
MRFAALLVEEHVHYTVEYVSFQGLQPIAAGIAKRKGSRRSPVFTPW